MKRTPEIVLALFLLAMGTALVFLLVHLQNLPAGAEAALNGYMRYRQSPLSSHTLSIAQIAFASNPSRFDAEMSGASFGGRLLYRTTYNYRADEVASSSHAPTTPSQLNDSLLSDSLKFNYFPSIGSHPIPFPPAEVWCVALNEEGQSIRIVFVASHQDLYNADWLVHEPHAYTTGELKRWLGDIGCNLELALTQTQ